jgi:hypothetical protein
MSRPKSARFSESFLRQVLDVLDEHPFGCTMAQVIAVTCRQPDSVMKALRIVAEKTWAGNRTEPAQYIRHIEADARIREHCQGDSLGPAPEPPALNYAIEGMCPGCTCDPDPSEFVMKDRKPVLLACPRSTATGSPWFEVAAATPSTGPLRRHEIPVPAPELRRRAVVRALRMAEEPQAEFELLAATSLRIDELTEQLTALQADGTVVRLVRTRPGSAGRAVLAVFALATTLPDPLRAS